MSPNRLTPMGNGAMAFLNQGIPQGQQHQILTPDEKQEIANVRAMQVRTAAADQSTKLLAGKAPSLERWLKVATCIENYILGQPQEAVPEAIAGRPSVP